MRQLKVAAGSVLLLCVALVGVPPTHAWSCSLQIVGLPQNLTYSDASVHCTPTSASEQNSTLQIVADESLVAYQASDQAAFSGTGVHQAAADTCVCLFDALVLAMRTVSLLCCSDSC